MKTSHRKLLRCCLVGLLLLVAGVLTGFVQLDYLKGVRNMPLLHPVKVAGLSGGKLTLADGRVFSLGDYSEDISRLRICLENADNQVDLEDTGNGTFWIYGSDRRFICGTSMMCSLVRIPVIPRKFDLFRREMVMSAVSEPKKKGIGNQNQDQNPSR